MKFTAIRSKSLAAPMDCGMREPWNQRSLNPSNVYFYGEGDLFEIAAAYAYHIAESQAYLDGNKRTAVEAALGFLELNGIDTSGLPELAAYEAMIAVAKHELNRAGLAQFLRTASGG